MLPGPLSKVSCYGYLIRVVLSTVSWISLDTRREDAEEEMSHSRRDGVDAIRGSMLHNAALPGLRWRWQCSEWFGTCLEDACHRLQQPPRQWSHLDSLSTSGSGVGLSSFMAACMQAMLTAFDTPRLSGPHAYCANERVKRGDGFFQHLAPAISGVTFHTWTVAQTCKTLGPSLECSPILEGPRYQPTGLVRSAIRSFSNHGHRALLPARLFEERDPALDHLSVERF